MFFVHYEREMIIIDISGISAGLSQRDGCNEYKYILLPLIFFLLIL